MTDPVDPLLASTMSKDRESQRENWTYRIAFVLVALIVLAVVTAAFWATDRAGQREDAARALCIEQGGVWLDAGTCGWSR